MRMESRDQHRAGSQQPVPLMGPWGSALWPEVGATEDRHLLPLPEIAILHASRWAVPAYDPPKGTGQPRLRFLGPSFSPLLKRMIPVAGGCRGKKTPAHLDPSIIVSPEKVYDLSEMV